MTAADLDTTKTYTLTVTRAAANASDDTKLSVLMVGGESVDMCLTGKGGANHRPRRRNSQAVRTIRTGVANGVSSIAISATPNHSGAIVNIFSAAGVADDATLKLMMVGTPVDADGMVDLSVGRNIVRIEVTAENGSTVRNYFLVITRAAASASG